MSHSITECADPECPECVEPERLVTTAREQAREAGVRAGANADRMRRLTETADAASDVWEPLLRDLLVAYEHAISHDAQGHKGPIPWGAQTRAREALGLSEHNG